MSKLWIKICGITRSRDALAAASLGADAIGLVFYPPSPRAITPEQLGVIVKELPGPVKKVALFVDPDAALVESVCRSGHIDLLQFHGEETAAFCAQFELPYIKAIRVGDGRDLLRSASGHVGAEMLLLDSFDEQVPGGTGKTFTWDLAAELMADPGFKVVVAGGLSPENVQGALHRMKPYGVDVSSGVEMRPGIKDRDKMSAFINGARNNGARNGQD